MVNRIEINNRRHYIINSNEGVNYLPSVTTVLGAMTDQSGILSWKKRVGENKAAEISKFSSNRGTIMHLMNENFFALHNTEFNNSQKIKLCLNKTYKDIKDKNYTRAEIEGGRKLFNQMYISGLFDKVKKVILQEQVLYSLYHGGYAGQVDKVYLNFDDKIIITDYKSSSKPKQDSWITGYKMQAAAYYVAFWERYKIKPHGCEIWISNDEDPVPQVFVLDENDVKSWYYEFCKLLIGYHKKFDTEVNDYIKTQKNK